MGDHTETTELDFDPSRVSYEELLELFWLSHSPTRAAYSRQYMSAIFFRSEDEQRLAVESRDRRAARLGRTLYTEIAPLTRFWLAEGYHQKYYLRQHAPLMRELEAVYSEQELVDSTVAARLNGYVAGHGSLSSLEGEISAFGLSPGAVDRLRIAAAGL
jgi:peptide-methionine (S)-S-oxide reductase